MSRRLVALGWLALIVSSVAACAGSPARSGPAASPRITCTGLPAEKCDEAVKSVARSLPGESLIAIEVTCASGSCTLANGFMDTVVTLPDGRTLRGNTLSWSDGTQGGGGKPFPQPMPVPVPPVGPLPAVEPICQGVPAGTCKEMAASLGGDPGRGPVVQILVRCKGVCTDTKGEGETVVTYADGTTSTGGWGYESAG